MMPLTDRRCRGVRPTAKALRLVDGGGLHLFVTAKGSKLWRMRYRFDGREKLLSFGPYPVVTLMEAREARNDAKRKLRRGLDPGVAEIEAEPGANFSDSFEALAREWYRVKRPSWTSKIHARDVIDSLEHDVFPQIGKDRPADITPAMVVALLRRIEGRPALETARRVRQRISAVFLFGVATGRASADPAAVVRGALATPTRSRRPAITNLDEARQMLADVEAVASHPVTRLAFRLLALTAVRPGDIRGAVWSEIEGRQWNIPATRMKMKRNHVVPLSRQALEVLEAVREFTGGERLIFPNGRHMTRPMSENAFGYLLKLAGYQQRHVPHGWRAAFFSIMNERYPADRAVIDLMLAHSPLDKAESADTRLAYAGRKAALAQRWADLLMEGGSPAAESAT